jgi:hypothetical protein
MLASQQLVKFFEITTHNNKRIANWYTPEMEVQVMVSKGDGEIVNGRQGVYTDNNLFYEWYNFRLPKNANSEPINNDHILKWPLDQHVEAIGMTGWNFIQKKSIRGGFDFDTITGHAKGVGVTDSQLLEIQQKALEVPELLVLKSTGGNGLHLYLEFDPETLPETTNHTEHSALMIACLKDISRRVGFDFQANMDVGGGNMWIYHRKMTPENNGLTLIKDNLTKDGNRAYMAVPENWRLYVDVAARKRTRVKISGAESAEEEGSIIQHAAGQRRVPLSEEHLRMIADLKGYANYTTQWVDDHHLLQTHTHLLKQYFNERVDSNEPLLGTFETISEGRNPSHPNCYCYPTKEDGWIVYRFGHGTTEHQSWKTSKTGKTYCYYNKPFSLEEAAFAFDGQPVDLKGVSFSFPDATSVITAIKSMGQNITIPIELEARPVVVTRGRMGIQLEIAHDDRDPKTLEGWLFKRGKWTKVYNIKLLKSSDDVDYDLIDQHVRALISSDKSTHGWGILHNDNFWVFTNKDDARSKLASIETLDIDKVFGALLSSGWVIIHLPFQDEFPGNRQWNLKAPKLKFAPLQYDESESSPHPHWDLILNHVGNDLNPHLKELSWAKRNGIHSGYDYLLKWIALMIREPFEPLPYLYLWGPQCSGKSMLHEAIALLMEGGVMRADSALTNQNDFNGELAGAVVCIVEEKNISTQAASVYNKLKDLVTSISIPIHPKHKQVYLQPNTTHWIQCANARDNVPIFPGDTRVTMIYVDHLMKEVPQKIMLERLEEEAPYFMYTLMNTALPAIEHRLRLPVVSTSSKAQMEESSKTALDVFIEEMCTITNGASVPLDSFFSKFYEILPATERETWPKRMVINKLPHKLPVGVYNGLKCIGNIYFNDDPQTSEIQTELILVDNKLVPK